MLYDHSNVESRRNLYQVTNHFVGTKRRRLFKHFIQHGIKTREELHFFIEEFMHIQIPTQAVCHDHVAPFELIAQMFFEETLTGFVFANRGGGKTQNVAILNFLDVAFKGCGVSSAGATLDQSGKCVAGDTLITCRLSRDALTQSLPIQALVKRTDVWVEGYSLDTQQHVYKRAEAIRRSGHDKVYQVSYDHERKVITDSGYEIHYIHNSIKATAEHPFLLKTGEWRLLKDLKPHDILKSAFNKAPAIISCIDYIGMQDVYNMEVEDIHNYAANDVIVHNCYEYFLGFWENEPLIDEFIPVIKSVQAETKLYNGGTCNIVAGTPKGLNGNHPAKARIDEVELINWDVLQEGVSMSITEYTKYGKVLGQDLFACVVGSTLIDTPRDLHTHPHGIPIQELVGKQDLWVYSSNPSTGKVTLKPVSKVWKTGNKKVWKLRYKYQQQSVKRGQKKRWLFGELIATSDHLVMLRDGTYKELQHLQKQDSLMPMNQIVNHEVISVEPWGQEDVYDMEVPGTHNFAANGIFVHNSTRKKETGTVQRMLDEAGDKDMTIFPFCIWETIEECHHDCFDFGKTHKGDPVHSGTELCHLYSTTDKQGTQHLLCGGQAHNSKGFIPVEEVIRKTKLLDKNTLDLQWLCQKGSAEFSVYGEYYNPDIHEITESQLLEYFSEEFLMHEIMIMGGQDYGHHHASLIIAVDKQTRPYTYIVLDEHYTEDDILQTKHVKDIQQLKYYRKGMHWVGDCEAKQEILEFNNLGLKVFPANKSAGSVFAGIDLVKSHLKLYRDERPRLFILKDRCPFTCSQMKDYRHPKTPDGKIDRDRVVKANDHCPDSLRYLIYTMKTRPQVVGSLQSY